MQKITTIELPAGSFYIYDPQKDRDNTIYSEGAFGCCYLIIEDRKTGKKLIAHVNATTIMLPDVANQTVQTMLKGCREAKIDIQNTTTTIVHTNTMDEYELAFQKRPKNWQQLDKFKAYERDDGTIQLLGGHYSERHNDKSPFVCEPFANGFLKAALEGHGIRNIRENGNYNSNLSQVISDPSAQSIKTDIIVQNGKVYLENSDKRTQFFKDVGANDGKICPKWNEGINISDFYLQLTHALKQGYIDPKSFEFTKKCLESFKHYMTDGKFAIMDINKYCQDLKPHNSKTETAEQIIVQQDNETFQRARQFAEKLIESRKQANQQQTLKIGRYSGPFQDPL